MDSDFSLCILFDPLPKYFFLVVFSQRSPSFLQIAAPDICISHFTCQSIDNNLSVDINSYVPLSQ